MHHIIQNKLFRYTSFSLLRKNLNLLGLPYEIVNKPEDIKTGEKNVWLWGGPRFAEATKKYEWNPGSMYNENYDYESYSIFYQDHLLNFHKTCIKNIYDPMPFDLGHKFFARPTLDSKIFDGGIFDISSWRDLVKSEFAPSDTRVIFSPIKKINQEIRVWIVDRKFVTSSIYKVGGKASTLNQDNNKSIINFSEKMADLFKPSRAFVLDICITDEGFKIVEINNINCSSFYSADMQKLLSTLEFSFSI